MSVKTALDKRYIEVIPANAVELGAGAGGSLTALPEREELIGIAAYYRAERRGFAPGGEMDDWLAAEQEVFSEGRDLG